MEIDPVLLQIMLNGPPTLAARMYNSWPVLSQMHSFCHMSHTGHRRCGGRLKSPNKERSGDFSLRQFCHSSAENILIQMAGTDGNLSFNASSH